MDGRQRRLKPVRIHCEKQSFTGGRTHENALCIDARLRPLTPDFAVVSYTATQDVTCGGQKLPAKVYVTNIYAKQAGKWRSLSYQETPIE